MGSIGDKKEAFDAIFTDLIQRGESAVETNDETFHKNASVSLIRLKTLNRSLQLGLDGIRKNIESKKNNVDKLKLELENLRYKEAYLKQEIRSCKDLVTPNLNEIELEMGCSLGSIDYTDNLADIHESTLEALKVEQTERIACQSELDALNSEVEQFNEKLEKKRKFVDELPIKLRIIAAATSELEVQFAAMKEEGV